MIRPGLLTASTSKADHLGTSALVWNDVALVGAPSVFGLGLKPVFPPRRDVGHEWVPDRYGQFATSGLDESRLLAFTE